MDETVYDVVIVGAGCTGYAAAMYAGRLELKTLLIGDSPGGLITWTDTVENYPGFIHLSGTELADKLKAHAKEYAVEFRTDRVEEIVREETGLFRVHDSEKSFLAKTVIFATGTRVRELEVPGAKEFANRGIQYCALCDGALFKDKVVAVVGGSDSAAKEALVLARYCRLVYVIYRGEAIRPEPANRDRIGATPNIRVVTKTNIVEVKGTKTVSSVVLDNPIDGKKELALDGVFVAIGHLPMSDLAKGLGVEVDAHGYVKIDRDAKTNVPGFFAAGDVVDTKFKQAIVGVGEAVVAVYSAYQFIANGPKAR